MGGNFSALPRYEHEVDEHIENPPWNEVMFPDFNRFWYSWIVCADSVNDRIVIVVGCTTGVKNWMLTNLNPE